MYNMRAYLIRHGIYLHDEDFRIMARQVGLDHPLWIPDNWYDPEELFWTEQDEWGPDNIHRILFRRIAYCWDEFYWGNDIYCIIFSYCIYYFLFFWFVLSFIYLFRIFNWVEDQLHLFKCYLKIKLIDSRIKNINKIEHAKARALIKMHPAKKKSRKKTRFCKRKV